MEETANGKQSNSRTGIGIAVGGGIGMVLGVAAGNVGAGLVLGAAIGGTLAYIPAAR